MTGQTSSTRLNTYYGPKRQFLGNHAGRPAPAWKTSAIPPLTANGAAITGATTTKMLQGNKGKQQQGSKIFLSKLPLDVDEKEVEELFRKTVGPLRECFLIYNNQGRSKGMAIVWFTRPGDAVVARAKYNGKIVDGRRPLKIEVIVDENLPSAVAVTQPASLLTRLGEPMSNSNPTIFPQMRNTEVSSRTVTKTTLNTRPAFNGTIYGNNLQQQKRRIKKGPKRIQKRMTVTREQLDKDMEDYRASADVFST